MQKELIIKNISDSTYWCGGVIKGWTKDIKKARVFTEPQVICFLSGMWFDTEIHIVEVFTEEHNLIINKSKEIIKNCDKRLVKTGSIIEGIKQSLDTNNQILCRK